MWCLPLISYWEYVTRILIFFGYCFCLHHVLTFKTQEHLLPLKRLIIQGPEDAMLKIRKPVYKWLFKTNRVLRADQKSDVNQTCQQSVFLPIGACIRIWCSAGAVERRPQMFFYRLSPFPFPHLCDFFTLCRNREPVHRLDKTWKFFNKLSFLKRSSTDISPCLLT